MKELDDTDRQLLALLQADDRLSLAELGKKVGLAPSSVNERIKRLVTRSVIEGFHAHVVPEALGLDLLAFVFVGWSDPAVEAPFLARVQAAPAVLECHHVTGSWNYLLKVRLPNTRDLERFLGEVVKEVAGVQRTETIIALSSAKEESAAIVQKSDVARQEPPIAHSLPGEIVASKIAFHERRRSEPDITRLARGATVILP